MPKSASYKAKRAALYAYRRALFAKYRRYKRNIPNYGDKPLKSSFLNRGFRFGLKKRVRFA